MKSKEKLKELKVDEQEERIQQAVERLGIANDATALLEERTVWAVVQEAYEGKDGDVKELQQLLLAQVKVNAALAMGLAAALGCLRLVKGNPFKSAADTGDVSLKIAKESLRVSARDMMTTPIQAMMPLEAFDIGATIDRTLKSFDEMRKGTQPNG